MFMPSHVTLSYILEACPDLFDLYFIRDDEDRFVVRASSDMESRIKIKKSQFVNRK